jgi:hypothetical protein
MGARCARNVASSSGPLRERTQELDEVFHHRRFQQVVRKCGVPKVRVIIGLRSAGRPFESGAARH